MPPTRSRPRILLAENYLDLSARARNGVFIHLALWLLVASLGGLWSRSPSVYAVNAALFALVLVARLLLEERLAGAAADNRAARVGFIALLLWNPLQWGVITALEVLRPELSDFRTGVVFIVIGIASAGGVTLVIEPLVRRAYPLLALVPGICMLLSRGTRTDTFTGVMAVLLILYILRTSEVVDDDYWAARNAQADLRQRAGALEVLSITDALTQLRNRPHFDAQLAAEWSRSQRTGEPLALLSIDLDHFKQVNDRHGHAVGDACLRAAAVAMHGALRRHDVLARYGGEEFAAMLPVITDEGAAVVAERMRQAVNRVSIGHEGQTISLSCSIGCHTVTHFEGGGIEQAMVRVDKAMYEAKQQGRNRVVSTRQ